MKKQLKSAGNFTTLFFIAVVFLFGTAFWVGIDLLISVYKGIEPNWYASMSLVGSFICVIASFIFIGWDAVRKGRKNVR